LVEQLLARDTEKPGRKMIELAKQGNVRCLEHRLHRLNVVGRPTYHVPTGIFLDGIDF
jgi:hypothetical protein